MKKSILIRVLSSTCISTLACLPNIALGADRDATSNEIIVSAERLVDEARDAIELTPGGVDLVSSDEFDDRLAVSFRDTLALSPGVYTQPRFGQEVRLSIRGSGISRGFHMRGILLFQDGMPINLADNNGDFQELDPLVFQHLEVYRGGNALKLGGSTLGGAVNAVTPTGRSFNGYELRLDGGSFNTMRGKIAAGFADVHGDAFLALTADTSHGERQHSQRRSLRFTGNVGLSLSDSAETRFYVSANTIAQDLPGSLNRIDVLAKPVLSLPNNVNNDQERDIDSFRFQNKTTLDLGDTRLTGGVFLNAKELFHPIFQVIDQTSTDYGVFVRLDHGAQSAPFVLSIGSNARLGHVDAKQFLNISGDRGAMTGNARQEATTIDSFAHARFKPVATVTLIAGGVLTYGKRRIENRRNPLRSGPAEFTEFSPKFGILFEPMQNWQVFANISRSVELPGYSELNQTPFAVGGVTLPGFVNVDPQRAWTYEIGTRGARGIIAWDITLYRSDINGEILQFNAGDGSGALAATFNADRTRHQGIEAGLDITPSSWLKWRTSYAFNDFTFRGDATYGNNRLPVIPRHVLRSEWQLGTENYTVTPTVEWVPQGGTADYVNSSRAPGYALFGARAEAQISSRIGLFLDARNIGNKKAIGDISAVVTANPASVIYYPVERRALYGGIKARF